MYYSLFIHETMVTRTRLSVTLYVHCMSCWNVVSKKPKTNCLRPQALRDLRFSLRCNRVSRSPGIWRYVSWCFPTFRRNISLTKVYSVTFHTTTILIAILACYLQPLGCLVKCIVNARYSALSCLIYSSAPHNEVSVNDGPHIRRWSHNIIILTIVLQLPTVFSTVIWFTVL
jgi:hypothetical protein